MNIRRVYRWERPEETFRWLALYVFLWHYQYLITFVYLYIIYHVLKKKYHPTTAKDIRESVTRAQSMGEHAYRLAEAIEKHGNDKLLENIWDGYGPVVQLQLGDLANLLEVLRNFYKWRHPQNTACTLVFFGVCAAMGLLTDMKYYFKTATFIVGLGFLLSYIEPVPKELRNEAQQRQDTMISEGRGHINLFDDETNDNFDDDDIFYDASDIWYLVSDDGTYDTQNAILEETLTNETESDSSDSLTESSISARSSADKNEDSHENLLRNKISMFHHRVQGRLGLLYLTLDGLVFESKVRKKILLRKKWDEIQYLRKESGAMSLGPVSAPESIVIGFTSEQLPNSPGADGVRINVLFHRNEAFNRIIGFSSLNFSTD